MSMWRKTLVYLGLVEEPEEYDEFPQRAVDYGEGNGFEPQPAGVNPRREPDDSNVRPLHRAPEPGSAHVRPMAAGLGARVQLVAVTAYEDGASEIGRQYRMGSPVLFDMADADAATARRLLDFVSGVTFALRGRMSKLAPRAFLIVPEGVELTAAERDRLASMGYGEHR
jgi:cell division inhibitor SepF